MATASATEQRWAELWVEVLQIPAALMGRHRLQPMQLRPVRHVLLLTAHHIAIDGWSVNGILLESMMADSNRRLGELEWLSEVEKQRQAAMSEEWVSP